MKKIFLRYILILAVTSFSLSAQTETNEILSIPEGGVPGQVEGVKSGSRIYFEFGITVDWLNHQFVLIDSKQKKIEIHLSQKVDKLSARESLNEQVLEQDLGGTLKKNAPLAYKNPKFRQVNPLKGEDPPKNPTAQVIKSSDEVTIEGGEVKINEYADGSKTVVYLLKNPFLKEESSYNQIGKQIWQRIEREDQGFRVKKIQWEDGSVIREYANATGILSEVFEEERGVITFSFFNSKREILQEVSCSLEGCE